MARSTIDICNEALGEIPADLITALDDPSSKSARICLRLFDPTVQDLLEHHDFDFSIRRIAPAAVENDRENEWGYAYSLPADLASPLKIIPNFDNYAIPWGYTDRYFEFRERLPFTIANGVLYTYLEAPSIEYISNAVQPDKFTSLFARAVTMELAARACIPAIGDRKRKRELMEEAQIALERAVADDINRRPNDDLGFASDVSVARGVDEPVLRWG